MKNDEVQKFSAPFRPQDCGKRAFCGNLGAWALEERQSVSSAKEISDLLRGGDANRAFDV